MKRIVVLFLSLLLVVLPVLAGCDTWPGRVDSGPTSGPTDPSETTIQPTPADPKPVTYDDLIAQLRKMASNPAQEQYRMYAFPEAAMEKDAGLAPGSQAASPAANPDHSQTNIQVQGVDEADLVKTDGRFLYVVANNRLSIIDARDPARMQVVSSLTFAANRETDAIYLNESILEIFLDPEHDRLTVLLAGYSPIQAGRTYTTTQVYDITNRSAPQLVRQFSQDGNYVTSRKIGSVVTVVTNEYKYWIWPMLDETVHGELSPELAFPATASSDTGAGFDARSGPRSGTGQDWQTVNPDQLTILPEGDPGSQTILASIDTVAVEKQPEILAAVGVNGTVYCSTENLYLFGMRTVWPERTQEDGLAKDEIWPGPYETHTEIYRFSLAGGRITASGQGSVPGTVIGQYSFDEYQGYLRVATTTGQAWSGRADPSENHVFVLDQDLKQVGQVTGLAEGETIRSVRFIGPLGYVVTFRTTDPLFVIDLHDPRWPKVAGELKIPGYSAYLHPYGDDRLIGIGYDVGLDGETAFEKGLKVSLFDIADPTRPAELSTLILGSRGSSTELSYNPRSLLFSEAKNLVAFPALLTETTTDSRLEYGQPKFQGLVVLTIANDRIVLRGGVTHADPTGPAPDEDPYLVYYGDDAIRRGAFIGNTLFTISNRQIVASGFDTLARIGSVELPKAG
ncbi:MAG: hypothetical protein EOM08_05500 [Clostridia bacterium]|nr:hypothetical protein [Clostridia bacterium]